MIEVTKEEAMEIRQKLKNEQVTICNKQAPARKKSYYVSESYPVIRLLKEIQSRKHIYHYE